MYLITKQRAVERLYEIINSGIIDEGLESDLVEITNCIEGGEWGMSRKEFSERRTLVTEKWESPNKEELNWAEAEKHLNVMVEAYEEIPTGIFALRISIYPIKNRFKQGERTKELYDDIMAIR